MVMILVITFVLFVYCKYKCNRTFNTKDWLSTTLIHSHGESAFTLRPDLVVRTLFRPQSSASNNANTGQLLISSTNILRPCRGTWEEAALSYRVLSGNTRNQMIIFWTTCKRTSKNIHYSELSPTTPHKNYNYPRSRWTEVRGSLKTVVTFYIPGQISKCNRGMIQMSDIISLTW